jgi:hypothetical protein
VTDFKHLLIRVVDSPSPLEYESDRDAEGDVITDGSYATPVSSSPVRSQGEIVGDAMETEEPTEGRLAEVGTLVPIEEVEEVVPDSESEDAPQENEEPLPVPEQPPAYTPVRRGQRAMRGGRIPGPHVFRRHCFPHLVDPNPRPAPTYSFWSIAPAKRQRTGDEGEDHRRAKRARIVESDDGDESDGRGVESPSRSGRGHEYAPSPGVHSSSDSR